MSSREITLWIDDRWYDALTRHLKDETVEDKLNDYLDTLVNKLPLQEYERISQEIYQEDQRAKEGQEADRKFAVFHIREKGEEYYFQTDRGMEFLEASRLLRSCLRSGGGAHEYMKMLYRREEISSDQFQRMAALRMENTGKVTGAFELEQILKVTDLTDRKEHLPSQLSGGQQQRVSVGRAMINDPAFILADEPTGNLDSKSSKEVMELLKAANKCNNQTLILITHDEKIALQADRIITVSDGRIIRDEVMK